MKVSIVAEGGVMRGFYVYGVLKALNDHYKLRNVDVVAGSSASSVLMSYYTAGQLNEVEDLTKHVIDQEFISLKNFLKGKKLLDLDFFIDEVIKKRVPLNLEKLKDSKITCIVPLVDEEKLELEYLNNRTPHDYFEVLRACITMPIVKKSVNLNGRDYFDGGYADPVVINHPDIINSRKIIILTKKEGFVGGGLKFLFSFLKFFLKPHVVWAEKEIMKAYGQKQKEIKVLEKKGDVVVRPAISFNRLSNNLDTLYRYRDLGYQDAVKNKRLQELIMELKEKRPELFI